MGGKDPVRPVLVLHLTVFLRVFLGTRSSQCNGRSGEIVSTLREGTTTGLRGVERKGREE